MNSSSDSRTPASPKSQYPYAARISHECSTAQLTDEPLVRGHLIIRQELNGHSATTLDRIAWFDDRVVWLAPDPRPDPAADRGDQRPLAGRATL
jgi:hypothetical protein